MKRSASVDLPWSMWAMIEKLRMRLCSIEKEGAEAPSLDRYFTAAAASALVGEAVDGDEGHRFAAPHLQRDHGVLVQAREDLVQLLHRAQIGVLALVHQAHEDVAAAQLGARVLAHLGDHDAVVELHVFPLLG